MKQIPKFPKYKITKDGKVWSVKNQIFLSQKTTMYGYKEVSLCKLNIKYSKTIHRLVLETFVGPCPGGMACCHNNGIRTDNRLSNLRWDTYKNNELDKIKHGTAIRGEQRHNAKLTEQDILLIKNVYSKEINGYRRWNQCQLAKKFNVTQANISAIVNKKSWKHLGENYV